ncbi:MAG: hypothetical protein H8E14_12890 [Candidatus Marinimicrobia bacterium]|nr:hypothetical protein [Candidatus Neomarinimicrobiota bacterium]
MKNKPVRLTLKFLKKQIDELSLKNKKRSIMTRVYFLLTLLATIIIAISTAMSYYNSTKILKQIIQQNEEFSESILIERDHYEKSDRPLIYIDAISANIKVIGKDSVVVVKYNKKNVGSVPAKNLSSGSFMKNDDVMIKSVDTTYFVRKTSLFPGQFTIASNKNRFFPIKMFRESPYLLIYILYSDIKGQPYYFQQLYDIKPEIINGKPGFNCTSVKWTDFN